ncbi:MAG: ATP:cob(I)alamin adenosyltransferase, partial [Anaerolineaceae bacterium]
ADIASVDASEKNQRSNITADHLAWIEDTIAALSQTYDKPNRLIIPGDVYPAGLLDVSRTIVRRAERRFVDLMSARSFHNPHILPYLNRLSSLWYALELSELAIHERQK